MGPDSNFNNIEYHGDGRRDVLLLFDVDGTLTPARQNIEEEVDTYLQTLRNKFSVGLVGGSDLVKIANQLLPPSLKSAGVDPIETCINRYDYVFAENGLVAYRRGKLLAKKNLVEYMGEEKLQKFINYCLFYMSKLQLPTKRGNFIEFRNGLINVCPVGRSCSQSERLQFNTYDNEHKIRQKFIDELDKKFGQNGEEPLGLVYSIGGQISFDVFPKGWDKTFCLNLIDKSHTRIHFFGDKTQVGGNDHEIYVDSRTIGHAVKCPTDTIERLKTLEL